jgi:hypothetical protein
MDKLGKQMELELTSIALRAPFVSSNHKFITYRKYFLIVNNGIFYPRFIPGTGMFFKG